MLPQLRHSTFIGIRGSHKVQAVMGGEHFEFEPAEANPELLFRARRYFDGRNSSAFAAETLGIPERDILRLAEQLEEWGFVQEARTEQSIPVQEFLQTMERVCRSWNRQLGFHKLFQWLENGRVEKEVLLGLMLETYHYVSAASQHIACAIANCQKKQWREMLSEYLAEEHNHAPLILETLLRMGLKREDVLASTPTPGTLALIHFLLRVGTESTLHYFVAMSFVEAREEDSAIGAESLRGMSSRFGYSSNAVEPILQHMFDDVAAGHSNLLVEALQGRESILLSEADAAANMLHDLKHAFDLFHDQILSYYSGPSNVIPRRRVNFAAL